MKIYTTSKGDEVLLDDTDYWFLIIDRGYTYSIQRGRDGSILSIRRDISACLSTTKEQEGNFIYEDILGVPLKDTKNILSNYKNGNPLDNQRDNLQY